MKQYSILLAGLLILSAGCQKADITATAVNPDGTSGEPVPVRFGLGQPAYNIAVKSAGSLETWGDNDLYIFGYRTGAAEYSEDYTPAGSQESTTLIYNVKATTSSVTGGTSQALEVLNENGNPFYYSGNYLYDFYGYYVDDAAATVEGTVWSKVPAETDPSPLVITTESAATPVSGVTLAKGVYVPIIIDGTQDIMSAEADKTADAATDDLGANEVDAADCYSAYAARRGVHPNLPFKHRLSRFTFEIKPGTESAKDVEVTGISIMANSKGFLGVVGENKDAVIALPTDEVSNPLAALALKERAEGSQECTDLTPVSLADATVGDADGIKAGESIMVIPGETSYQVIIETRMKEGSDIKENPDPIVKTLELSDKSAFEAGKSYNIVVTVYSPEEIVITATLTAWEDGEEISVGQDDDQKPSGNGQ